MIRFTRSLAVLFMSLALLGVLATPTVAKPGGNSAASASCAGTGYLGHTDANGTAFKNEGQCSRYAATGGILIQVPMLTVVWAETEINFTGTVTGSLLMVGAIVTSIGTFLDGSLRTDEIGEVSSTGNVAISIGVTSCNYVSSMTFHTIDRDNAPIEANVPVPC